MNADRDPEAAGSPLDHPDPPPSPKGLERGWAQGETFPWKGIWFRVASVRPDFLVLIPEGTTWQQSKKLEELRAEADATVKGRTLK